MPIDPNEIQFKFSGGAANSDPFASIGGAASSVAVPDATLHALFPAFKGGQAAAGYVRYRCIYIKNADPSLTLSSPTLIADPVALPSGTLVAVGLGTSAVNGIEQQIENETVEPLGVAWGSAALLPNLTAGQTKAVWISWTCPAGTASANGDECVLTLQGDDGT